MSSYVKIRSCTKIRRGKSIKSLEKIEAYYNSYKHQFSVRTVDIDSPYRGKIIAYTPYLQLHDVQFIVYKSTFKNEFRTFPVLRGSFGGTLPLVVSEQHEVVFDKDRCVFVEKMTNRPIKSASYMVMYQGKYAAEGICYQ